MNIFAPCDVVSIVQVSGSSGFSISGRPDPVGGLFNADFPDGWGISTPWNGEKIYNQISSNIFGKNQYDKNYFKIIYYSTFKIAKITFSDETGFWKLLYSEKC